MTDDNKPTKKSLAERAKALVDRLLEALEDLVPQPQPALVPVRVRPPRHRRRR